MASRERDGGREDFAEGWRTRADVEGDDAIERFLAVADPRLGAHVQAISSREGPRRFKPSNASSHFDALARSIVYQQVSKHAAASIYARYVEALRGVAEPPQVVAAAQETLRAAGLSRPKIRYLKALAAAVEAGDIDLHGLGEQSDDDVVAELTKLPGIGVWTAQMFLMFRLGRPDVLPTLDLGIQRGLQLAHGLRKPAAPGYVQRAGKRWAPYRSIACLYLWVLADGGV